MNMLFAQTEAPVFTGDWKVWLGLTSGMMAMMIVGRFIHAFRNGAGLIGSWNAVLYGTNTPPPEKPVDKPPGNLTGVLMLLVCVGLLAAGCKTTSNPGGVVSIGGREIDPVATGNAVRIAAKYGTLEVLRANRNEQTRTCFECASTGIALVIASGDYSPTNITATLERATGSQTAALAITDALGLYQDFFGKLAAEKLEARSPYTVPVLTGLATGIQQALDLTSSNAERGTGSAK